MSRELLNTYYNSPHFELEGRIKDWEKEGWILKEDMHFNVIGFHADNKKIMLLPQEGKENKYATPFFVPFHCVSNKLIKEIEDIINSQY